jgi:hypothetical protein
MNWELIIWIAIGLIVLEVCYLSIVKQVSKKEVKEDWITMKIISLGCGGIFVFLNWLLIAFPFDGNYYFIRLLYAYGGSGLVLLFFYLNKKLAFKFKGIK